MAFVLISDSRARAENFFDPAAALGSAQRTKSGEYCKAAGALSRTQWWAADRGQRGEAAGASPIPLNPSADSAITNRRLPAPWLRGWLGCGRCRRVCAARIRI